MVYMQRKDLRYWVERANRKNRNKLIESVCWFRGIKGAYLEDDYGN